MFYIQVFAVYSLRNIIDVGSQTSHLLLKGSNLNMKNPFIIGSLSWLFPGAGYFLLGRTKRGLIISGVIWSMFIIAIISGGAYYPGLSFNEGALLYLLHIFATLGNGLGYLIGVFLNLNPPPDTASTLTFEYGGRFLEVAGLLNFLAIIDIFDIYSGRKE